jgi:hypothetical protein
MDKMPKRSKKERKRKPSPVSGLKASRAERLDAGVRVAREQWLKYEKILRVVETAADKERAHL